MATRQLRPALSAPKGKEEIKVNRTLKPVKKGEKVNAEIEKNEVVISPMSFDGFPATFIAGGEKHHSGGTKVNLPKNSFVFSDDTSMKIKDEDILESFNKNPKESGYTPADLARPYNINKFRKVLADPDSDKMQRETAEEMIKSYNEKLGKLSLTQESQKHFKDGIPFVAIPYLDMMGLDAGQLVNGAGNNQNAEVPTQGEEDVPQQRKGGELKIRIKSLPKFKEGGSKPPKKQEFAYNKEFYDAFAKKLGLNDITAILPSTLSEQKGMVDDMQPSSGTNTFGRKDWTSAELFPDFRNRNAWYFKEHPEFNPKNKGEVRDFQEAYNKKAIGMGLSPYFTSDKDSKYSKDDLFGEVTYSVPNLEHTPVKSTGVSQNLSASPGQQISDLQKPNISAPMIASTDNPFWTEDLINVAGDFGNLTRIKKYMPWQAGYDTVLPEPTFYDPTRELAANAEQTNIADQALGAFAGPQALSARLSSTQGQGVANAANILGKYNNLNVGIANQNEAQRAAITNESNINRANQATNLYDKTILTNQNFDNAKTAARNNLRSSVINAWSNRGKTQALNSMNKQFRVDPITGYVKSTGVPGQLTPNQQGDQVMELFDKLRNRPGATDESATALLKVIMGGK